jgi:isoleucyl-tRNA synthetase
MFVVKDNEIVNTQTLNTYLIQRVKQEGCDFWFDKQEMNKVLSEHYSDYSDDYSQVFDVVDVWVDSGLSHQYVNDGKTCEVYLEGSDQHRGWFQASALLSVALDEKLPFENIVTHGFILDKNGKKMSKSEGNVVSPEEIQNEHGTDVLRLWVAMSDGSNDVKIGKPIIDGVLDINKKLRNTLKYLLGVLYDFSEDKFGLGGCTQLEDLIINDIYDLNQEFNNLTYDFHTFYRKVYDFCDIKLSRFYFDIRKDTIYCDSPLNPVRRATLTTLTIVLSNLIKFLAPVMPFTIEEVRDSINFDISKIIITKKQELKISWQDIFDLTSTINSKVELLRSSDNIGSTLETVMIFGTKYKNLFTFRELDDISKSSEVFFNDGDDLEVKSVKYRVKCSRCWKRKEELYETLCSRCSNI